MTRPASDILCILAPPLRLVNWLDKVIPAREKKGETVPPEIKDWLDRWRDIRSHLPAVTDVLTDEEWNEIGEMAA